MRNQIAAAEKLGIRAHTINSTNRDAWDEVRTMLSEDSVDLLLISPERLNNPQFRNTMLPLFAERVGLLVVDEAHCISDWGHDFRPDYRRLAEMLERLPAGVAVLCTTATANDRVVADVADQLRLGHAGALKTYRGPLGRDSLRLEVVELPAQADRLAWLATHLPTLPGSGIVYTLTKRDADTVAEFLSAHGVPAEAYSGEVATERRVDVEERLLRNELKAVVATSALGMGYDKPDLGFVVHYQAPGSVISYYQQVGRAGRAIERADVVLLRGREDRRIQDFFIEQAFPPKDRVDRILEAIEDGATTNELMGAVNLGKTRIEGMLKVLDVEGAVAREGTKWLRVPGSDWRYDGDRYAHVTALRRREQEAMAAFGADGRCLMRALQEELDDPDPVDCGVCAVCTAPRFTGPLDPTLVREAALHLRSRPLVLEVKKMAPDPEGKMRKLGEDVRAEEGRALARLGDGGWDPLIADGPSLRPLRRRARRGGGRGGADLARPGPLGRRRALQAQRPARAGLRPAPRRGAEPALRRRARARRRQPAAARDDQLRPAGRQRPRRVRGHGRTVTRAVPAGRRRPLQRLDAGDGGGPAPPQGLGPGSPVRPLHRLLIVSRAGARRAAPRAAYGES